MNQQLLNRLEKLQDRYNDKETVIHIWIDHADSDNQLGYEIVTGFTTLYIFRQREETTESLRNRATQADKELRLEEAESTGTTYFFGVGQDRREELIDRQTEGLHLDSDGHPHPELGSSVEGFDKEMDLYKFNKDLDPDDSAGLIEIEND